LSWLADKIRGKRTAAAPAAAAAAAAAAQAAQHRPLPTARQNAPRAVDGHRGKDPTGGGWGSARSAPPAQQPPAAVRAAPPRPPRTKEQSAGTAAVMKHRTGLDGSPQDRRQAMHAGIFPIRDKWLPQEEARANRARAAAAARSGIGGKKKRRRRKSRR